MTDSGEAEVAVDAKTLLPGLEALLFAAEEPLPLARLAQILSVPEEAVEEALRLLQSCTGGRGIHLMQVAGGYQFLTRPEYAHLVHQLRQAHTERLGRGSLETLAVIAYNQPITRPEIEALRGVNSSYALQALLSMGLVRDAGRKPTPGRPYLYRTTQEFLRAFGLATLDDLPPLQEEEAMPLHPLPHPAPRDKQ